MDRVLARAEGLLMKPTTFRMRNKQRLMALMIAGTVVGLATKPILPRRIPRQ